MGRGSTADIRVGRNPTDNRVSRSHLSLSISGGLVTVTRRSQSQLVIVRSSGVDYPLNGPGEAVTRTGAFEVLLPKTPRLGEEQPVYYRIIVRAPTSGSHPGSEGEPGPGEATATSTAGLPQLSRRERQVLCAYARPLLAVDQRSRPSPSSHAQVAAELNYSKEWVREQIDALRLRLASQGWPVGRDKDSPRSGRCRRVSSLRARWRNPTGAESRPRVTGRGTSGVGGLHSDCPSPCSKRCPASWSSNIAARMSPRCR